MLKVSSVRSFTSPKIISLRQAIQLVKKSKSQKKRVGLCHGGFDLLHPGHVKHFESAKALCDVLIVSVTSDQFVSVRKGEGRPIFSDTLRAYMIAHLVSVDYVVITDYKKGVDVISFLKPTYYIKGPDFIGKATPGITAEREAIQSVGGEIKYTKDPKLSTTDIIEYIQKIERQSILVILDRDGTLIVNDDFPGKSNNWREEMQLNNDVVSLLSYLQTKYKTTKIVVSNQSGVARGYFDEKRVREINKIVASQLVSRGVNIDSWQYCPDVDRTFVLKNPKLKFQKKYIKNHPYRKPAPDMVYQGLKEIGKALNDFHHVLVIGNNTDDEKLAGALKAKYICVTGKNYTQLVLSIKK